MRFRGIWADFFGRTIFFVLFFFNHEGHEGHEAFVLFFLTTKGTKGTKLLFWFIWQDNLLGRTVFFLCSVFRIIFSFFGAL